MEPLNITDVEIIQGCGIVVTFSDGTVASYAPEELAALRPYREQAHEANATDDLRDDSDS